MVFKNRELETRPLFPVGANVFVFRDGRILLGRRKNGGPHDGEWGVPGGHLEEGESMLECAARELAEETGMTAASFRFAIAANDPRPGEYHYIQFAFVADGLAGDPVNREPDKCYGWEWFPLDNLPERLFVGHTKLIRGYLDGHVFVE